jgi:acetyl esterase
MIGSVHNSNIICSEFVRRTNAIVMSVEYRLAPQFKYPVPLEDIQLAFQWISKNAAEFPSV